MTNLPEVGPRQRVIALVVYCAVLLLIHYWTVEQHLPPSTIKGRGSTPVSPACYWAAASSILTSPRPVTQPSTLSLAPLLSLQHGKRLMRDRWRSVCFTGQALIAFSYSRQRFSLLSRPPLGAPIPSWIVVIDHAGRALGAPNVIYTVVIIAAVWVFHRSDPLQVFSILTVTLVIVAFAPVDRLLAFYSWIGNLNFRAPPEGIIGVIAAHQSPGIVLIRQTQTDGETVSRGSPLLVCDDGGPHTLGVALNYVGRDEGNLLRILDCSHSQ